MIKFTDFFLTAINLIIEIPRRCIDYDDDDDSYLLDHPKTEDREVNWLDLPDHILSLVAYRLNHCEKDLVRFGAVCHPWQSVYADIVRRSSLRLPLLMLSIEDFNDDDQTRSLYNLRDTSLNDFQVPVPHNMHIPGSSHGWLFTVCPQTFQVRILNPFLSSNNEISLPPLTAFQHGFQGDDILEKFYVGFLQKAVLSTNPTSDPNYVIMAIYKCSSQLAFYRPGDNTWTSLDSKFNSMIDVIYYRDQFYVINRLGQVFSFDFNHHEAPKVSTVALYSPKIASDFIYLVESAGDLLQIVRHIKFEDHIKNVDPLASSYYYNNGFNVFKLDPIEQTWVMLYNLGGRILFLGHNSSLSISASDFPECKPNSIYFTDDWHDGYYQQPDHGGHDMGICNLQDRTLESHFPVDARKIYPPPVWIEPPLLGLYVSFGVEISKEYMDDSIFDYQKI